MVLPIAPGRVAVGRQNQRREEKHLAIVRSRAGPAGKRLVGLKQILFRTVVGGVVRVRVDLEHRHEAGDLVPKRIDLLLNILQSDMIFALERQAFIVPLLCALILQGGCLAQGAVQFVHHLPEREDIAHLLALTNRLEVLVHDVAGFEEFPFRGEVVARVRPGNLVARHPHTHLFLDPEGAEQGHEVLAEGFEGEIFGGDAGPPEEVGEDLDAFGADEVRSPFVQRNGFPVAVRVL